MPVNQLAKETSPYLQQHADNPVDWHAWNDEALELARDSNRPILLSIGYSACHWCHVMAHESFEDEETAKIMNRLYVNIKVDREERPDLDKIYQAAHYLLTQRNGGWPLTVFLTPDDQMPFFAGTYFPQQSNHGLPGFRDILQQVAKAFDNREVDIRRQNQSVQQTLGRIFSADASEQLPSRDLLGDGYNQLLQNFDPDYGGFGKAPKFPHPSNIDFLLHLAGTQTLDQNAVSQALSMAVFSLENMASGGIFDHLAGGFCRYSVDDFWLIPHFEKMLYDNGPLLSLYSKSYSQTGNTELAEVARLTADWVIREMQAPEGGYYSSFDADSEGEEGKFYVWTPDEIQQHLNPTEYDLLVRHMGLDQAANFEGNWHLHRARPLAEVASELGLDKEVAEALLTSAREQLYQIRSLRTWPGRDDKILLSWNALMAKGMLEAAWHCQNSDYSDSAIRALDFIRATLWQEGRLLATCKDGKAHLNAYIDDYAFLLDALIARLTYQWDSNLLSWTIEIADCLIEKFEDQEQGGFFFTSSDHEQLIQRPKAIMDEATPSGYAIAVQSLQTMGWLLGKQHYLDVAERALKAASHSMQQSPAACASLLVALQAQLDPPELIILRGDNKNLSLWQAKLRLYYRPGRLCFAINNRETGLPDVLENKHPKGAGTAYFCQGTTCSPAVENLDKFIQHLKQL